MHHDSLRRGPARVRLVCAALVLALLAAGCGDDSDTETGAPSTDAPSTTVSESTTTSSDPEPSTPTSEDELPGESFDLTPGEGTVLAVAGVAFDDTLAVRQAPGADQEMTSELDPTEDDFVATGRARLVNEAIWWEITTADGVVGWVNSRFTAQIGSTNDVTSQVVAVSGDLPTAATMEELGARVADALGGDAEAASATLTVGATVGDLGEITYDLVGLEDDALFGFRLHVFGTPGEPDGFTLKSVESTDLCDAIRGVSESGQCV